MFSNRVRKTAVAAALAASVIGTGVLSVSAQDSTPTAPDTTQSQQRPGRGFGRGIFGGGLLDVGPSGDLTDSPVITAIADALKLDAQTLVDDLQSGKSVTDLATAQNVDIQTVYDAVIAKHKQLLDAEVSTGYLTQAQADERLQNLTDNIANFPLFNAVQFPDPANNMPGFGQNGPRGGFGGGFGPQGGPNGNNGPFGHHGGGFGPQGGQPGNQPPAPPTNDSSAAAATADA